MDLVSDSTLVISALSRPLHLGMLYNTRNDQLIPGFKIWTIEAIEKATKVRPQPDIRFQIAASESLSEKNDLLDVSASVKLSFLGGLIEAGGSAHYLKSKTSSKKQCSVTLRYHKSTEFKELIISQLDSPDAEMLNKTDATHVVIGVLYGADAIMEFQETVTDDSNKQEVQGNLNVMIKKIPSIEISGDGCLKMDDNDKKKVQNFSCKCFGDFDLKENPSTYEEAVRVYKELPTLMGEKGEKAVPVKVWLYPLSKLYDTESKLKHMISEMLVSEIEKVMNDFHLAEMRTNDLLNKIKEIRAEDIVHKLEQFRRSLRVFTAEFLQKIADLIPGIRGGDKEVMALTDLLKFQEASVFSGKDMEQWLDEKATEINIVMMYLNKIQNYTIKLPGSELDSFLMDPDITNAFVFSFTSLKYEELYLKKISQAVENFKSGSTSSTPIQDPIEEDPWYKLKDVKKAMDFTLSLYNNLNPINKVISFISDREHPGASFRWYKNAVLVDPHVTSLQPNLYACDLTLDPNTAHRRLSLSDEYRKVTYMDKDLPYPKSPERFNDCPQVLCKEGLSGRHYWETEWIGNGATIAVSYKSIKREGDVDSVFGYNDKSWCLTCYNDVYNLWYNHIKVDIPVQSHASRVGVYLDWPAGTLTFYSVHSDTLTHLYTFYSTFTEPLYPGFWFKNVDSSVSLR